MSASAARRDLARMLLETRPALGAETLEAYPAAEAAEALAIQPAPIVARVLELMVPQQSAAILDALGDPPGERAAILEAMSPPRAAVALRWLPPESRDALIDAVGGRAGRELREALAYPDGSAGSLMDPQVYVVRPTDTAGLALERIAGVRKPLYQIYVVDDDQTLLGVVPIQHLAAAAPEQAIAELVSTPVDAVDAFTHRDEVVEMLSRTATPTIAVVDAEGHLIGALRHRTLLGIAEEEAAAMVQQMVGASAEERALSPVRLAVKKRLPWLNINLLTAFLAAAVVGLFESTIAQVTSLAVLLPVVAGQSGNSGSQALAVTMRSLALREIRAAHWPRIAAKEIAVGFTNGVAIAAVTGAGVWIWSGSAILAGVIGVAMIISMAAAGLAGASVPIVLKSLGQDPAQSSSIILTTVTDVVGFSSFLGLASLLADRLA